MKSVGECAIILALGLLVAGWILYRSVFPSGTTSRLEDWTIRIIFDVKIALYNWNTEYDALPLVGGEVLTEDIEIEMKGELLTALLGESVAGNKRGITFLVLPPSRGARGLVEQDGVLRLVDQWGTPVRVLLDGDHDNKVANPDVKNADEAIRSGAPPQLRTLVAVFSAGKDGVFFTKDDVVSWR